MISKIEEQKNTFGVCAKCDDPRSNFNWCPSYDCAQLIKNFDNWTSGNDELDEFIQNTQSTAKSYLSYLEWIPYESFESINKIGSGKLSDVYSAIWKDGERIDNYWDEKEKERGQPIPVVLKCHERFDLTMKVLTRHHRCTSNTRHFIQHYGVTKDPKTGSFIIVMQYANDGILKEFLRNNEIKHDWQWKLNIFRYIAQDLSAIHNAGLVHGEVTNRNVFIRDDWAYIGQLYWSISKEELNEMRYEMGKSNDIFDFGNLMKQIATESIDSTNLSEIPKPILKLINSCLNGNFKERPDINKILYILEKWCGNPQIE